ncbi:RNA polymerase sigma factor [Caballeronia sp. LZ029]|uniref:RNA polymerase sigma factor n=1 Tax=Caballeronia sp. LZ029 TaxID=3038564 RepID=UPI002861D17F|nr:RNA polymerase sigma factor [Caballeronia sp. LZ029]MDR5746049.1 RNA polymerase sigma factor [Caballeronia sp. LZ029]
MSETAQTFVADDDLSIARRIVAGDRAAFELLMRRHNRRLYRLARASLRNDAEAEDALQDAYLHAYRSMSQFRGDAQLSTWLSRLVLNECFARIRRSARRQNVIPIVDAPDWVEQAEAMTSHDDSAPDDALARSQVRALLESKLDALPELFRIVFVLRSIEEMTVEETAQCLNIPEATVRSRHFRARGMLRESLAQAFDLAERDVFEFGGARCDRIVASVVSKLGDGGA